MTEFQPVPFGKYVLLERIGVEPTAELFRGRTLNSGCKDKPVLIKRILPQFTADHAVVNSMKEAARISTLLHHPNIVQILDFGNVDNTCYIATEYLTGRTLQEILNVSKEHRQPVEISCALHITEQICGGLKYAHCQTDSRADSQGIIHTNISPQSIFITSAGEVKIAEFGVNSVQGQDNRFQMGMFKGKVAYMSPEQVDGKAIDCRSDLFSLGTILYEMVTGKQAFEGETIQVFSKVRHARFEPPENVVDALSPELCRVIRRTLGRQPKDRYGSAGDMLTELEEVMLNLAPRPDASTLVQYVKRLFIPDTEAEAHLYDDASHFHAKSFSADSGDVDRHANLGCPKAKVLNTIQKTDDVRLESDKTPSQMTKNRGAVKPNLSRRRLALWSAIAATVVISFIGVAVVSNLKRDCAITGPKAVESAKVGAGVEALKAGLFDKAVNLFDEVLADEPTMLQWVSKLYAQALEGQASGFAKSDLKKAEKLLVQAIKFDPKSVSAFSQLGLVYLRQKDFANAAKTYERVVQLDGKSADTFFNLGYIYAVQERYDKAEGMYARVVELAPSFLDEALFNLAMVQDRLGKRTQSVKHLRLAIKTNPENSQARQFLKKLTG